MLIAVSGHRPKYFRNWEKEEILFIDRFHSYLQLVSEPVELILGGADGVDTAAAKYAIFNKIPYQLHVPFPLTIHAKGRPTQEKKWELLEQHKKAKLVKIISYTYDDNAYFERDKSMVNTCDILLAWYLRYNTRSGSYKCVKYAKEIGKPVIFLKEWTPKTT